MKVMKPLRLGVLTRTFEDGPRFHLVVTLLGFFPIDEPRRILMEPSLWKLAATELGPEGVLDECMPKLRGEVLVKGDAYPRGGPAPSTHVRAVVGPVDKTLYVFGDRRWRLAGPTDPAPFARMPITYANAFGGEGYERNPAGKGYVPVEAGGGEVRPLPNVEDPAHIVRAPGDRPEPAGLMPHDIAGPQRRAHAGTYDDHWLKERYPGFPRDFDFSFFSVAPPDQRIEGFFQGGEAIRVENMNPTRPVIEGRVPSLVGRCFVNVEAEGGLELREVRTKIDTIWLFPGHERLAAVWRGVIEVREDDAADVRHLIAGFEDPTQPKPLEHYRRVLAERLDRSNVAAAIRDRDLLPAWPRAEVRHPDERLSDMDELMVLENLLLHNARRGAERQRDQAIEELRARGLDPGPVAVALPPIPDAKAGDLDDLPDQIEAAMVEVERLKAGQEEIRRRADEEARATCAAHGLDYDKMVAGVEERRRRVRRFSAKEEIERLEDMLELARNAGGDLPLVRAKLAEKGLVPALVAVEAKLDEMYRRFGHHYSPAEPTAPEGARGEIEGGRRAGRSFAGRDFTGVDLAGVDLSGVNLEGAFLEGANLRGADLSRCNLKDAVLVRADLEGARVAGAILRGANLGHARLRGVDLSGMDLSGAVLAGADLSGAKLARADLGKADLSNALLAEVDLSGARLVEALVLEPVLRKVDARGVDLTKTVFFRGTLEDVDFGGANLTSVVFVEVRGERVAFRKATMKGARFVKESSFPGADFTEAALQGANLRGTILAEARFEGADLRAADLSECDLQGAAMAGVEATDAMLVRADLRGADLSRAVLVQAILQKARVDGARFEGANLFRADMARVRGDAATSLRGAFVKRVRMIPAKRSGA
jgi:uncharacterized protein YjbI with pentapeptide repeats